VCVLELGEVKEYDTPARLLANPNSEFTAMVNETGPQNAAFLRSVAFGEVDALHATDTLVEEAKKKIEAGPKQGSVLHNGPLMTSVDTAAMTMQLGFEERHYPHWERELATQQVSLEVRPSQRCCWL
jgi:ABC-type proline/glycine betaine transport system ATPase subunit